MREWFVAAAERGPHGVGKTSLAAWVILWFADTRDRARVDWKAITTAGGRAIAAHTVGTEREIVVVVNVGAGLAFVNGKAGAKKAGSKRGNFRNGNFLSV